MNLNTKLIIKIIGYVTVLIGFAMIPCLVVSVIYKEPEMIKAFAFTLVPLIIIGSIIVKTVRQKRNILRMREGVLIVAISWIWASLLGTLPYMVSGTLTDFTHAFFESVSGFTTTGSSVIENLSEVYKGLLFWRSLTTWIGAMGILVFAISILPTLGIGAQNIAKAETTGPTLDKVTTKISDNAKILYLMYIGLSTLEIILFLAGGLNLFDAIIHTFGSMGTGGLSNYEYGIVQFDSAYVETIISLFSIFASINFVAYNHILHGKFGAFFKEPEIRAFFIIMATSAFLISLYLYFTDTYDSLISSFRHGAFQVVSFMSTSGYVTANYEAWPLICKCILIILMFIGGCSASTSGSIKVIRIVVLFKLIKRNMYKVMHPRAVVAVKMGDKPINAEVVSNITVFILLYMLIFLGGSVFLSIDNVSMETAFSACISSLSNTGVGLGDVGFGMTFDIFSNFGLFVLSLLMLIGRLELFTIIMLFIPSFWRPDKFR